MAITNTIFDTMTVFGNKRVVYGKSVVSGGSSGGDVITGLTRVDAFTITMGGASQQGSSVNETLPLDSGTVTVVNETANSTFYWMAIGQSA